MDEKNRKKSSFQGTLILVFVICGFALIFLDVGTKLNYEVTAKNTLQIQTE